MVLGRWLFQRWERMDSRICSATASASRPCSPGTRTGVAVPYGGHELTLFLQDRVRAFDLQRLQAQQIAEHGFLHLRPLLRWAARQVDFAAQHGGRGSNHAGLAFREVDRGEGLLAEHVHGSLRFVIHAGGFERGHATVGERQAGECQIFVRAEQGHAHRLDVDDRTGGQRQDQVQIMDHQVQHDAHIGGSEGVRPGAHGFDVLRTGQVWDALHSRRD